MRILCCNDFRLAADLRALGAQVLTVGRAGSQAEIQLDKPLFHRGLRELFQTSAFQPDAILWMDNGDLPLLFGLEALEVPTVAYMVDDYCNPWHAPYSAAFDVVFTAQRDYVALFDAENLPRPMPHAVRWAPLFCDHTKDVPPHHEHEGDFHAAAPRDIPVSFVGTLQPRNIPHRLPFLEAFRRRCPLVMRQGAYQPVFQRSRLVLNQSAIGELNFRVFEAMGCGAALLTEDTDNGLRELFRIGEEAPHPYPRGDAAAAAAAALALLAAPERLAAMAAAGCARVRSEHTSRVRAQMVLDAIAETRAHHAPAARLAALPRCVTGVATAAAMVAAELTDPDHLKTRRTYANIGRAYAARWDAL